jgi:hypothetical protein
VVTVQLTAPTSLTTTLTSDHLVHLTWTSVSGTGVTYRLERAPCLGCGWSTIASSIASNSYDFAAEASTLPAAWLYHVIATANGATDSPASNFDYAIAANVLFAEPVSAGTTIKGSHLQEVRRAIDALRSTANLPPYMTPTYADG